MEQLIGVLIVLSYISYMLGREKNFINLSGRLEKWRQRPARRGVSRHEYIENVLQSNNEKYWAEKKIAADKERVKKNFL